MKRKIVLYIDEFFKKHPFSDFYILLNLLIDKFNLKTEKAYKYISKYLEQVKGN